MPPFVFWPPFDCIIFSDLFQQETYGIYSCFYKRVYYVNCKRIVLLELMLVSCEKILHSNHIKINMRSSHLINQTLNHLQIDNPYALPHNPALLLYQLQQKAQQHLKVLRELLIASPFLYHQLVVILKTLEIVFDNLNCEGKLFGLISEFLIFFEDLQEFFRF